MCNVDEGAYSSAKEEEEEAAAAEEEEEEEGAELPPEAPEWSKRPVTLATVVSGTEGALQSLRLVSVMARCLRSSEPVDSVPMP